MLHNERRTGDGEQGEPVSDDAGDRAGRSESSERQQGIARSLIVPRLDRWSRHQAAGQLAQAKCAQHEAKVSSSPAVVVGASVGVVRPGVCGGVQGAAASLGLLLVRSGQSQASAAHEGKAGTTHLQGL